MKPKHQRLLFVAVSVLFLCAATLLALRAFRANLVFFYSPTELAQQHVAPQQLIRIGGLVAIGSVHRGKNNHIEFDVTDGSASVHVAYQGLLPNLFREGQGVVAEGRMADASHFAADTILAKHDERYMPREVVDALKKSGRWKGD